MKTGCTELRLAEASDLGAIAEFLVPLGGPSFADRFPGATARDFYAWKYFENPLRPAIVAVAIAAESVVSVVAAVPKRIWLGGRIVLGYELGDFLTRDDYRKQGLFSRLIDVACSEAGQKTAQFVYVRPNEVSFPILANHLSFVEAQRVDSRRYVVPSQLLSRKTGVPASAFQASGIDGIFRRYCLPRFRGGDVSVVPVEQFGDEADQLWERASKDYEFAVVRDKNYLNWRFAQCPTPYRMWHALRNSKTVGFIVASVNRENTMGAIVDLFTEKNDAEAARALLSTSMSNLLGGGVGTINTWTLQGTVESAPHSLLRRATPFRGKKHLHLAFRILASGVPLPSLPEKWHFTLGDCDGA